MQGSSGWAPANEDAHLVGVTVSTHQDQQIAQAVSFRWQNEDAGIVEDSCAASPVDAAPTVTHWPRDRSDAGTDVAVVQAVAFAQNPRDEVRLQNGDGQIAGALSAESGMHQTTYVAQPLPFDTIAFQPGNLRREAGADPSTTTTTTLKASAGDQTPHVAYPVVPLDGMNLLSRLGECGEEHSMQNFDPNDPQFTLRKGGTQHGVLTPMAVRRLTPVECERLQGFPDNWSRIPWKGKPESECPKMSVNTMLTKDLAPLTKEDINRLLKP